MILATPTAGCTRGEPAVSHAVVRSVAALKKSMAAGSFLLLSRPVSLFFFSYFFFLFFSFFFCPSGPFFYFFEITESRRLFGARMYLVLPSVSLIYLYLVYLVLPHCFRLV